MGWNCDQGIQGAIQPSKLSLRGLPVVCPRHMWKPPYGDLREQSIQKQATELREDPELVPDSSKFLF